MLHAAASLHALRAFVMHAPDKNSRARVNYSGEFLSILCAIAFCTRVFESLKRAVLYAIEFDTLFQSSRYPTARRRVQMTNKVRIV